MGVDKQDRLVSGVRNLLFNCAQISPDQNLLIVHENAQEDHYDPGLVGDVFSAAKTLGMDPQLYEVAFEPDVKDPDPELSAMIGQADCTVFLARLGDQIRFRPNDMSGTQIICYALDRDMLASDFGNADYRAFEALKHLINAQLEAAQEIHVTCPAGTDVRGGGVVYPDEGGDVTIKRFPMSVFTPAPAREFTGRVAQVGFLVGTGSNYYLPYACKLSGTLLVNVDGNRITDFDGTAEDVAAAHAHYDFVGEKYGIDPYFVHSWHAGIHPGCSYEQAASANFGRWTGGAFGNPRLLHFHTCGQYAPGEISLNVVDPTVRADGIAIWENGVLCPDRIEGGQAILDQFPCAARAFRTPAQNIGLGSGGRLSFN